MSIGMTERKDHDESLTISEVAAMHRVNRRTVERWIKDGVLLAYKLPGGLVRIHRANADALATPTAPSSARSPQDLPPAGEGVSSLASTG